MTHIFNTIVLDIGKDAMQYQLDRAGPDIKGSPLLVISDVLNPFTSYAGDASSRLKSFGHLLRPLLLVFCPSLS